MSYFALRFVVCLALALSGAQAALAQGWAESSIVVDGVQRWYRIYVPAQLPRNAPLLLSLHGGTGSMHTIDRGPTQGWARLADRQRFLLVVPNGVSAASGDARGTRQNWNDLRSNPDERQTQADDVGFVRSLLDHLEAEHATDPGRVYVTGNSNGGLMTYRLLLDLPHRFAAAAAFIANLPVESSLLREPARATPLMIWLGTNDQLMKFGGGDIPGARGKMRSASDTVAWWVRANRASAADAHAEALPDLDPADGCRVQRTLYPAQEGGAPVLVYLADGGGHTMPSQADHGAEGGAVYRLLVGRTCRDVDGVDIAWEFMSNAPRTPPTPPTPVRQR